MAEGCRFDQHRRTVHPPTTQRLAEARPALGGRWGYDDQGRAAREAAGLGRQHRRQRQCAAGLHQRQDFQNALGLAGATVGGQAGGLGYQADDAALIQQMTREAGCRGHRVFFGALEARAGVDLGVQVEDDPDVGGRVEIELAHHQLVGSRGGRPVDAVEGVARAVIPHR